LDLCKTREPDIIEITAAAQVLHSFYNNDIIGKNGGYFSSIFIALGFIPMICSYLSFVKNENY
jgi:hypothetical protein